MKKLILFLTAILVSFFHQSPAGAEQAEDVQLRSGAAILMDAKSGTVLFEKRGHEIMYPASLTKIATAIYAIENGDLSDIVTVSRNAVQTDGTRVYLVEGEQVTLEKLIQGMLINSGNDAAVAIAEHLHGSVEDFSRNLTEYLHEKSLVSHTNFTNPHGLFDENHYSTAADLAKITSYAINNPVFKSIFGTKEMAWKGQSWDTTLVTHHLMIKGEYPFEGVTGGKTGFINESKQTLATTAENKNIQLTVIILQADYKRDAYQDTISLFEYGFKNFKSATLPASSEYSFGNQKYKTSAATAITEPLEGMVKRVDKKGLLAIENQNGEVLQTIQLEQVKKANKKPDQPIKAKSETVNMNALYGIVIIIAGGALLSLRYRTPKRMKKRRRV
ncbi:D-alanyl-D-alanine carboxypeptidase [Bacillus canaveralius]|uniref:D-alanyl-D-alanine carboxypeptidase n=1 Tax=Bacillus canaveralius TaxID=1403243 RepID=A0A2N5GIM7_9BACI|nr:D-alanyl-D-alanine carboxypeptidase family protein [Bacillus canaveralius]PLR80812.1 D-alanyl-D-alanine carboxypeptidase [Bacillus canaveralius]PLR98311.1 D-alanyl-D-alanine carboxypeptidase [Bacillus canaveralius]